MIFSLKKMDRLCLIVVLLLTITGTYLSGRYRTKDQKRVTQEVELASRRSMELSAVENDLKRLKDAVKMKKERLKTINNQTPEQLDIGSFLKQLNALIEKNAIALISIRPLPSLAGEYYTRIPVQLICKGSFKSIFELLQDLEGMKRNLIIERIAISRPEDQLECGLELTADILKYDHSLKPL